MSEKFEMVAKTFQGLEGVLSDELKALGADDVKEGRRMVSFKGDKEMMYRANFCLRTALRVLKPIHQFKSSDADDLYRQVKDFDWSSIMTENSTFSIDTTVFSDSFRHSRFVTYRVKDAIADYFNEKCGKRPSIRLTSPDFKFNVHISDHDVILSLDSSGEPLYKRGWRVAQTDAPINEVLAAGILKLSGWDGKSNLVDPMCGSGTFLIEAALMAANINPGVFRTDFAFQHWADYDSDLYDQIYNDDSQEREFNFKIFGSDVSPKAIAITRANVKSAGVAKHIDIELNSIQDYTELPAEGKGVLVTNPPYGERLKPDDLAGLYATLGEKLKRVFRGYDAWVIASNEELIDQIGLKPSVKYPLFNGDLPCELREYVIFDGSFSELRRAGGSIKNEGFRRSEDKRKLYRRDGGDHRPSFRHDGADKPGRREGGFGKRREGGDDRRFGQGRRDEARRRFDRDGEERRQAGAFRSERPYAERGRADDENGATDAKEAFWHSEAFRRKMLRGRKPTLGVENERPIVHGRRNGWKRKGLDESNNDNNNSNNSDNNTSTND